jgi:hypothetical protein
MKTNMILSAFTTLAILGGSAAAFAQSAPAVVVNLKPGQTVDTAGAAQTSPATSTQQGAQGTGIVGLKPGQTFGTSQQANLGAAAAGAYTD